MLIIQLKVRAMNLVKMKPKAPWVNKGFFHHLLLQKGICEMPREERLLNFVKLKINFFSIEISFPCITFIRIITRSRGLESWVFTELLN